jgi:hypothetical protein
MGMDNYSFRYEAYKNNTFDLEVVEKSLEESKMSAYQYLRQFQIDSTGYKRFDFKMQDIYRTNKVNHVPVLVPRRWVFFIDYEFINVGKRLAYKRSSLYEKDLSFDQIINRPDLFDSTFLVFIDGKLYNKGIHVLCKEDKTYIIFTCRETPSQEGFSIGEMREYIEKNSDVSIYFIPNTGIKNISTNAYRCRTLNYGDGIPLNTLGLVDYMDYNKSIAFCRHVEENSSSIISTELTDTGLYVDNNYMERLIRYYPDNTAIDIQLIPLRNLFDKIEINHDRWFEIPMQDYPVAVENCLIIDEDGMFVHDAKIKHYYPNIYEIINIDDVIEEKKLYIYVFYFENKINKLKHLDMLAAYHKYVPHYLDKYRDGSIPSMVKKFNPLIVPYSIKDYKKGLLCNKDNPSSFITNDDGKIYKVSINNNKLISDIYEGNDVKEAPNCYYVLDHISSFIYKIYMENGILCSSLVDENVDIDILYVYDPTNDTHNKLEVEDDILALFEFMQYEDHFKYKIHKMREFIKSDVNNFRRYLRNLGLGNNYYYVDVSKIDLNKRKRKDNTDTKLKTSIFNEEMYMFIFRNDFRGMYDDIIIHVDGTRYDREIQLYNTDMLDYVYIPCRLVKPDTMIEIEKVSDTSKHYNFIASNKSDIIPIDIGDRAVRNKTLFNDLFIVDNETGNYLDPSSYQIILPVKFHMDDIDSDIILDYIITENDKGYYQLAILDHGLVEIYRDDDDVEHENAYYLSLQDNKQNFYQFDMSDNKPKFNKIDAINGYAINKIRSMNDKKLIYQFKMVNGVIKIEIAEDDGTGKQLAEGGFNLQKIEDVFLTCPRTIKIKITDANYLDKKLSLHIKKVHNMDHIENTIIKPEDDVDVNFKAIPVVSACKKDPRYFRVYSNGRLVPRHLGMVKINDYNLNTTIDLLPGFVREPNVEYNIAVESMPYMMKQVCYLEKIPTDKAINLKGLIDKPFDFKWYDIYLNGKKLVKKDVEIITANIIKILKTDSIHSLEIIENSRDIEYFGGLYNDINDGGIFDILDDIFEKDEEFSGSVNDSVADNEDIKDTEKPTVDKPIDPLDFVVRKYYEFLINSFGFINPDELQLSLIDMNKFNELADPNKPFELGFDAMGSNRLDEERLPMPINPDE